MTRYITSAIISIKNTLNGSDHRLDFDDPGVWKPVIEDSEASSACMIYCLQFRKPGKGKAAT